MARVRSPNYPAISLPEAIARAKTVHEAEQHLAAPREVIAKHLGFNSLHGGANRIVSALTKYGLLEEVSGDKFKVSPLAISILHPTSPAEKASAIKEAASKPALFTEIASEWNGVPSEANLRTYLIRRNFAADALDRVIQAYKDTMELVTSPERDYNKPASHDDRTPSAARVGEQVPMQPKAPEIASAQRLPSPPSPQESGKSLPFHVAITDGGLEIAARIKNEGDVENLIQILQTMKPLLQNIYRRQSTAPADQSDPPDVGDHAQRVFETSMAAHKEAGNGVSFIITQAQKDELRRRGYSDEQIRDMKPEEAHRVLGLIK